MRRKSWYLSLYFAVILVLSLLLSLSFNSGACLADNWTKTAGGGFETNNNSGASPMAKLGGVLYTGTSNSAGAQLWKNTGSGWTKAGEDGFGNPNNVGVSSMVTFNSKLYIGTRNTTDGGEVYSYDGSTFVQVNNPGFHSTFKNPWNFDVPSMAVLDNKLFAGTHNLKFFWNFYSGCEIYRYTGGTTWALDKSEGFGDSENLVAASMCVYNNKLYVGTQNLQNGCEIWRRNLAGAWEQVDTNPADDTIEGFGNTMNHTASTMMVHNGNLYVGVYSDKARIWKYDGSTWSPVGQSSLGESGEVGVASLADFGGVLYAGTDTGTAGNGCQVWRSEDHGETWLKATSRGFGNTNNTAASSLAVFDSKIFAGTVNEHDGCEIWSSLGLPGFIQSVTPSVGRHGQTLDVTVVGNGTHFVNGVSEGDSKAQFSGKGIKVNSTTVIDQRATANITIAPDAGVGTRDVNVITNDDTPTALQGSFTVLSPKITGVSPSSVNQGQTRDVVITGADTDFINWSNQAEFSNPDITVLSTTPVDATHLKAKIQVGHDAMPEDWDVGVKVNTDGIVVDPLKDGLTVKAAPPRLDSVSPHYGAIGDTVTLKGDWFGPQKLSSKVAFNGVTASTKTWSEKKIVCKVPAGAGMINVVVTTGAGSSNSKPFNIVNTKVGTNVKVDLGGGASVVFDKVTSPGNTVGTLVQDPFVDPNTPIRNGTLDITTTAGYSGNVTVTMSYAGYQLLEYQEAAIAMFHEEGDGWRDITLSRDTQEKTVTGQASGLSRFTLQIAPASAPATATWYLAEGSTDYGFDCYITIENPNDSAVTANVTYMTGEGPVDGGVVSLPAKSQATINPRDTLGNKDFSTKVVCNEAQILAVDRTMTWTGPGAASPEAHSSVGVTGSNTTWYLPEGSSNWGFECYLLIQNPNATDANCEVTYMIEGGAPQTFTKQVPANSRKTFNMADDIGEKDASIKVDSDQPVIPERAMYRNNRREGHDSIGTTEPANNYYLAEGSSAWGFTTYVLVQNPNEEAADVTLTYMTTEGLKVQPTFTMPANSRETIRVNDALPDKDFSTKVSGSKPIIAERAMYWDNGTGEATHDSIGESGPHKTFYMPDGDTRIDWQTWTLVQNPNDSDVEVEISYLTATGAGNIVFTETIPANSRRTFSMGDKIMNQRAAILVRCMTPDKKIMCERAMYFNNKGLGTSTIGGYSD